MTVQVVWYDGKEFKMLDVITTRPLSATTHATPATPTVEQPIIVDIPLGRAFDKSPAGTWSAYVRSSNRVDGRYFWAVEATMQDMENGRAHKRLIECLEYAVNNPDTGTWVPDGGDLPFDYQRTQK